MGYNNIDVKAARKAGVHAASTPGVLTKACADFDEDSDQQLNAPYIYSLAEGKSRLEDSKFAYCLKSVHIIFCMSCRIAR